MLPSNVFSPREEELKFGMITLYERMGYEYATDERATDDGTH